MSTSAVEACRARRLGQGSRSSLRLAWAPLRRPDRRARWTPPAVAAALPPPLLAGAATPLASSLASLPASAPLAAVVPTFPRIGGQAVRDWIGQAVDNLPGFNGDDLTRLLFPDLVGLVDGPTFLIGLILAIAFIYWEGGILLRQLRGRRQAREHQRQLDRQRQQGGGAAGASGPADVAPASAAASELQPRLEELHDEHHDRRRREDWTPLDRARHERRRGLGWLALATAGLIWLTGVVNNPTPFQP